MLQKVLAIPRMESMHMRTKKEMLRVYDAKKIKDVSEDSANSRNFSSVDEDTRRTMHNKFV